MFSGARNCEDGIERLEKQILQFLDVFISHDQVNIALLKKCKTVDVPAVYSVIGNMQKALQKYVEFSSMEWILSIVTGLESLWIELRAGVWILNSYTIKLKFIQLIPLRVMHWMWECSLIILN